MTVEDDGTIRSQFFINVMGMPFLPPAMRKWSQGGMQDVDVSTCNEVPR
jgi:hypothetical protein